MTNIVQEVQNVANKVYKNGLTYAQNIQNGVFIPAKALKNHAELKAENKVILDEIKAEREESKKFRDSVIKFINK